MGGEEDNSRLVLLVDEDMGSLQTIAAQLENLNVGVVKFPSPKEALKWLGVAFPQPQDQAGGGENGAAVGNAYHSVHKCVHCNKEFNTGNALGGHIRSHNEIDPKKRNPKRKTVSLDTVGNLVKSFQISETEKAMHLVSLKLSELEHEITKMMAELKFLRKERCFAKTVLTNVQQEKAIVSMVLVKSNLNEITVLDFLSTFREQSKILNLPMFVVYSGSNVDIKVLGTWSRRCAALTSF